MSMTVILAFFVGMLFRDICLYILVRLARRAKARGMVGGAVPSITQNEMEALAKAVVESTTVVELDEQDGMLYCYSKADGMFLAQAADMDGLCRGLRQRFGTGKHYILDDNQIIST